MTVLFSRNFSIMTMAWAMMVMTMITLAVTITTMVFADTMMTTDKIKESKGRLQDTK